MATHIPSAEDLKARLAPLGHKEIKKLSEDSGVPFTTLWKVKDGTTSNPGVETVRKFWPHLVKHAKKEAVSQMAQQPAARDAFLKPEDDTPIDNSSK